MHLIWFEESLVLKGMFDAKLVQFCVFIKFNFAAKLFLDKSFYLPSYFWQFFCPPHKKRSHPCSRHPNPGNLISLPKSMNILKSNGIQNILQLMENERFVKRRKFFFALQVEYIFFDHLLWSIFQSLVTHYYYNFFKFLHVHGDLL